MSGTVKIWWHDGATKDVRYNDLPVVNEPELAFESVAVSGVARASQPAPAAATVALIETDVNVRYRVSPPGGSVDADSFAAKPMAATGPATDVIGVGPGCTISFIEA